MSEIEHVIHSESQEKGASPRRFEWKLVKAVSCWSNQPQGFLLRYREKGEEDWHIFVDASLADGQISVNEQALKARGVLVEIH